MDDDGRSPERSRTGGDDAADSSDRDARAPADETGTRTPPAVDGTWAAGDREESLARRFLTARDGPLMYVRETLFSVVLVGTVGLVLFGVSGVWPPMVAVESGSMKPHMQKGDLVFVTEPGRYLGDDATFGDAGVVTHERGEAVGYRSFGDYGSVVVYDNPSRSGPPIIHRVRFHVEAGENWYDRANPAYVTADDCAELAHCPAEHAGFITKGDNNELYDQEMGLSGPVKAEWMTGTARVRVPLLGWIRLYLTGTASPLAAPVEPAAAGLAPDAAVAEARADGSVRGPSANRTVVGTTTATDGNRTVTADTNRTVTAAGTATAT
jgi:signal peptidase